MPQENFKSNGMNTDAEWEKWGKNDPYFGVITHPKFRSHNLNEETKKEFFESGRNHIGHVLDICRQHLIQGFSPKKVLDFGCGVGRLVIPFAEIAEHVVGLDVSESMLKEALKNCNEYSVQNVDLLKSDDNLSSLDGCFDLIHSFIVFQHIPVERGKHIFTNLLDRLNEGGICVIQLTYSKSYREMSYAEQLTLVKPIKKILIKVKRKVMRLMKFIKRLVQKTSIKEPFCHDPEMQMNPYNLNEIIFLIQSKGIRDIFLELTNHGGELGVFLYFRKPVNP